MRKILKMISIMLVAILVMFAVGCSDTPEKEPVESKTSGTEETPLKVALNLVGPANDGAWSTIAYEALLSAKEKYGIDFVYSENLKPTDMEATFTDYASQGVDLIIGHSFSFGDAALAVGERFPDVSFAIIDGVVESDNVASYNLSTQEHGYLQGIFAAMMTKTGKVGAVMGVEGPSIIKIAEAFKIGVRSVDPNIEVQTAYTGSFDDAARCKEAAQSMIDDGVDIIMGGANQSNAGMIKACEEAEILCMGEMEQKELAPKTVAFCNGSDVGKMIEGAIEEVLENRFSGGIQEYGYADDVLFLTELGELEDEIPKEVKDKVQEVMDQIKSGEIVVEKIEQITG